MSIEKKTTALVRASQPIPMQSVADMQIVGEAIAKSGMFGVNNASAGLVVAATCHSQGISLLEFSRTYHIINNKPSMRADAMLAEFRKRGGKYVISENGIERASAEFEFEGQKFSGVYTMEDARRSGDCFEKDGKTLKHNWQHRAENMLWARMVSRTVRLLCPEIVAGIYTPEEVEDFRGSENTRVVNPISVDDARAKQVNMQSPGIKSTTSCMKDPITIIEPLYDTCPLDGDCQGARWDSMPNEWLESALNVETLEEGHKATIRKILGMTKEGEQ